MIQHMHLSDWLMRHIKDYGASVQLICDTNTPEAMQFFQGFGGIGGVYVTHRVN